MTTTPASTSRTATGVDLAVWERTALARSHGASHGLLRPLCRETQRGTSRERRHPTEPSICSWISRFISTAYSIGSSFTIGSMKPETIIPAASSLLIPRLWR